MTPQFLKTEPGADPVIVEGHFNAPPARVYRAWTRPEEVKRWFGRAPGTLRHAEIDLRVGGHWRFSLPIAEDGTVNVMRGQYLQIEPDALLVFSWVHERTVEGGEPEVTPQSRVTVRFEPSGTGTHLTLRHEGIKREAGRRGVGEGWESSFSSLAIVTEDAPSHAASA